MIDESLDQGVDTSRKRCEWTREQDEGHQSTEFCLEAIEKRYESDHVNKIVEEPEVEERECIQSVHYRLSVIHLSVAG